MTISKNYLEKLNSNQILNLAQFVVEENFNHHSNNKQPKNYKNSIDSIYNEEINYFNNSEIFVAKNNVGSILGSIRILKWNYSDLLPLQKIFGINPLLAIKSDRINNIYHIGRFAIKKGVRDINLFKQLMVCAIGPVCENEDNVVFAECDRKLLRILTMLGIEATVIGESITYLGSETIPIAITQKGLINFYNKNKALVSNDVLNTSTNTYDLPKSVVFSNLATTTL